MKRKQDLSPVYLINKAVEKEGYATLDEAIEDLSRDPAVDKEKIKKLELLKNKLQKITGNIQI